MNDSSDAPANTTQGSSNKNIDAAPVLATPLPAVKVEQPTTEQHPIATTSPTTRASTAAAAASNKKASANHDGNAPSNPQANPRITDLDVLVGRGKGAYMSAGNLKFQELVNAQLPDYKRANKNKDKIAITNRIVQAVHNYGGRFLKEEGLQGQVSVIDDRQARIKVAQALRRRRRIDEHVSRYYKFFEALSTYFFSKTKVLFFDRALINPPVIIPNDDACGNNSSNNKPLHANKICKNNKNKCKTSIDIINRPILRPREPKPRRLLRNIEGNNNSWRAQFQPAFPFLRPISWEPPWIFLLNILLELPTQTTPAHRQPKGSRRLLATTISWMPAEPCLHSVDRPRKKAKKKMHLHGCNNNGPIFNKNCSSTKRMGCLPKKLMPWRKNNKNCGRNNKSNS